MKTFKQFLSESQDPEEVSKIIYKWREIKRHMKTLNREFGNVNVNLVDGTVDFLGHDLVIYNQFLVDGGLPVTFNKCKDLTLKCTDIKTLRGMPRWVRNIDFMSDAAENNNYKNLTSFEFFPRHVEEAADISQVNPNLSLTRFDRLVDSMSMLIISPKYKGPLLSLLRISNLNHVTPGIRLQSGDTDKACDIITMHLRGDKDMLDCQEELRSAGLREYGRP